jgi:hypothetical protein
MDWWGHSKNGNGNGNPEPLMIHLNAVANRVSKHLRAWNHAYSGIVAGIYHNFGKYADQFNRLCDFLTDSIPNLLFRDKQELEFSKLPYCNSKLSFLWLVGLEIFILDFFQYYS